MSELIVKDVSGIGRTISKKHNNIDRLTPNYMSIDNRVTVLENVPSNVWKVITADNYVASDKECLVINTTTSALTLFFPANPVLGSTIKIIDYGNTFDSHNLNINGNSKMIMGSNTVFVLDTDHIEFNFYYTDAIQGWKVGLT